MLNKIIIASLFVSSVFSKSSFIGNSKRAELFELTDNEVAVFRITLPEDEYAQLKEDISTGAGMPPPPEFDENGKLIPPPGVEPDSNGFFQPPFSEDTFKSKNATMTVELNNNEKSFDEVTFSLGGSSSRMYGKQGYNIKIRNKKKDLYGRKQIRLRPDAREATYLRSKLTCDIHNRLGLPSVSANYATLYINDEYLGFYILLDAFKLSWLEYEYDDKDSTTLYQCKDMNNLLTVKTSSTGCGNENEEVTDNSEWIDLLTRLDEAESAEDIEDIFDVDQFLTEIAFEYLSGSWDHYLNFGHNFYMYKPKNDKWKFLLYDFDGELGQDVANGASGGPFQKNPVIKTNSTDYPTYTFDEWAQPRHLIDILILKDSTRFDNILRNFVKKAFNPAALFPHIDELKEFIRPYVKLDKIADKNGKYPGRLNDKVNDYSLAEWDANCEFTRVDSSQGKGNSYGLKYWILAKYRYVCKAYDIDCDPVYLDENYEIPIDKEVESKDELKPHGPSSELPPVEATSTIVEPVATNTVIEPVATNTIIEAIAITTDVKPTATNTVVEPAATTTDAEKPATTTKESKTSTRRRKCTVKKSSIKKYKTKKINFNAKKHNDKKLQHIHF